MRKKDGFIRYFLKNKTFFFMLLPGVIMLIINNYIPMFGIIIAFKRYRFFGSFISSVIKSDWIGLDNFKFFFSTPYALEITRNTLMYNIVFIALDIVVPITLAIMLNEAKSRIASKLTQSIVFIPFFLSWIVVGYLAFALFSMDNGFINRNLLSHIGMNPIRWYSEPVYWPFILICFHLWKYTGYNVVVYIAAISGIDSTLYESSSIDGATKMQQARFITLPMLKSIIIILALLAVGRIFNADFGLFYNVTKNSGALSSTTQVIDTFVFNTLMNSNNISLASASGAYQSIVGCITVVAANFIVKKVEKEMALF